MIRKGKIVPVVEVSTMLSHVRKFQEFATSALVGGK
jgi:hypothetical protein